MEATKWKNFSTEDFSWKWNGVAHSFPAGMEIYLEKDKAEHFTKHLVDRELGKLGFQTDNKLKRDELSAQCYPTEEVVTPEVALNLNEVKKEKKTKKVEEFPELKNKK